MWSRGWSRGLVAAFSLPGVAFAQGNGAAGSRGVAPPAAAASTSATPVAPPAIAKSAGAPRRDPRGVVGVTPSNEALLRGDKLYLALDYAGATRKYQEAVTLDSRNALAHLRLSEALFKQGQFAASEEAARAAHRFASELPTRARALYWLGVLQEAQKKFDAARQSYLDYEALDEAAGEASSSARSAGAPPGATGATGATELPHLAAAGERVRVLDEKKKREADYEGVRARIAREIAEADEAMKKSSR